MELESSNLIKAVYSKQPLFYPEFSYENDIKIFTNLLRSILGLLNVFIISFLFILFIYKRTEQFDKFVFFDFLRDNQKNLSFYQDIQNNFCDNFRNVYNKDLEEKIFLYTASLNGMQFDMFLYKNFDYLSWKIQLNNTFEGKTILHMLNALKYYSDKYSYKNDEILIIDFGTNVGLYTTIFGSFNYSILSFEPLPENYYILKKNFCRNNNKFFKNLTTISIVDKALYNVETICDYYKDLKNSKKNLILCDNSKIKNLDKDYIKIGKIKTTKLNEFINLIKDKQLTLLIFDLEYEGETVIESGKEIILKYHIPYIFIEFNLLMFALHETKPQSFLRFFTQNGYKISLNGFLTDQFISVEDLMRTNFVSIDLYIVYVGS